MAGLDWEGQGGGTAHSTHQQEEEEGAMAHMSEDERLAAVLDKLRKVRVLCHTAAPTSRNFGSE